MYFSPDGVELDIEDTEKAGELSSLLKRNVLDGIQDTTVHVKNVSETDIHINYPPADRMASRFMF